MKKMLFFIIVFLFVWIPRIDASTGSASSYVLMDETTGRVLASKNMNSKKLIASITKIMTCVLAIESNKIDDLVTVDETIEEAYGSGIYIQVGEKMKLRDLLYGLMLRSGNDAAVMIASYVGGSVENFVKMMNKKAEDIGMKNTIFSNPSGLDNTDSGNYSTAYDMAILTKYAMQYNSYKEIVATKSYKVKTNYKTYVWENKNKLLRRYDYITGGKTGYTERAHRTLVSTASKNNMDLIVVTLNDSDDWNTHVELYNYAFNNYISYRVLAKDNFKVIGDTHYKGTFYINNDIYIPLLKEETGDLVSHIKLMKLDNYNDNSKVGVDEIYLGDQLLYTEDVYIDKNKIESKKSFFTRVREFFDHD